MAGRAAAAAPPPTGGAETSEAPVSLGHIGDIEFYGPNRGALITSGNGGSVKPGVWFYDGGAWRELSDQCGATDGRIAWAGPDEFWTVSDGRAGQALASSSERPPLQDNTLCHFAPGPAGNIEIVGSYGSVPFLGSSYQAMHAAGCLSPGNCWFGGDPLPAPQIGAFMLHWNGAGLEPQPFLPEGHPVWDMVSFEGRLYESMRIQPGDKVVKEVQRPPALRAIKAEVSGEESPFESVPPENHLLYSQRRVLDRAGLPAPQHQRRRDLGRRGRAGARSGTLAARRRDDHPETGRGRMAERDRPPGR